jgi:TRAP-type C4-dicarboxylate transport system permease small subunit
MHIFKKIVEATAEISGYAALAMTFVIVLNIIMRIVWKPLIGTYELVGIFSVVFSSFALSYAALEDGHISVSILLDKLPKHLRNVCNTIVLLMGIGIVGLMAWSGGKFALKQWHKHEMTDALYIPLSPFRFVWVVALTIFATILVVQLISLFANWSRK